MIASLALLAALAAAAPAAPTPLASGHAVSGPPAPARPAPAAAAPAQPASPVVPASGHAVTTLTVYGNDPCPRGDANEIVVCARRPEGERYRIPPDLRHKKPIAAEGAWTNSVSMLDEIGRQQMMPGSCSVNGVNGQTGCTHQMLHQWYLDRQQQKQEKADVAAALPDADIPPDP